MTDEPESAPSAENAAGSDGQQPQSLAILQTENAGEKAGKGKQNGKNAKKNETNAAKTSVILLWIKRKASEAHLADWFMVFFTLIIAGATITYTVYARRQWRVMSGTLDEMKTSGAQATQQAWSAINNLNWMARTGDYSRQQGKTAVDASNKESEKVLKTNIDAAHLDQRAWIGVKDAIFKDFSSTVPWTVTVIFVNSGKTPARNAEISSMFTTSPVPIRGPSAEQTKQLSFHPIESIAPQGTYNEVLGTSTAGEVYTLSQVQGTAALISQYEAIKSGALILYYFGTLRYDDAFGKKRETQYCIFLANPSTKEIGFCDDFNDLN